MSAAPSHSKASKILYDAINEVVEKGWNPQSRFSDEIGVVILGSHLTFRYILLTGLLAKSVDDKCNPLTLQAGSTLPGAYDARSLCHKVVVPMERELLGSRLGGSNEPFLNKPARFPEISSDNAVRRGSDSQLLGLLIYILGGLNDSNESTVALKDAIHFIFKRPSKDLSDYLSGDDKSAVSMALIDFGRALVSESIEGETSALLAGVSFDLIGKTMTQELDVKVHPVNQAGSSSNEISDIDCFLDDSLFYTAEVKDKPFEQQDVDHAVSKAAIAGAHQLIFLIGPRGQLREASPRSLEANWKSKGFSLIFLDLVQFFETAVSLNPEISYEEFFASLDRHASQARVKDETFDHIKKVIRRFGF